MLFVNENFSRVRAELSQAAEEEESVASVAASQTPQPSFSSIAKESHGYSGSWSQIFRGKKEPGKLCMPGCSECWICWHALEEAAAQWRALPRHEQSEYTARAAALRESRCWDVGRGSPFPSDKCMG